MEHYGIPIKSLGSRISRERTVPAGAAVAAMPARKRRMHSETGRFLFRDALVEACADAGRRSANAADLRYCYGMARMNPHTGYA